MTLSPGTRLGPYEIQSAIGAGGMGEVYKARDTRLGRDVAIKVLPSGAAADPERRVRFEREAKTIAGLNHPHICTLHDVGEHEGSTFLVMEHLTGETLAQRLQKGPLPLEQALTVATEIADALAAAHRQGVIHRDLKPGNVMLTKAGAKLLDFGLAKLKGHGERPAAAHLESAPTQSTPLTGEGMIVGTLQYMAPEQVEGKPADARTDLWALGAILYEMVTGRRAFEGASAASLIGAILQRDPVPPSTLQPLTPPALDRLVRRCLAKAPEDRPDTAHDVADELGWMRETSGVSPVAGVQARRRWGLWAALKVAGVLAAVALGAGLMWLVRPLPPRASLARPSLDVRPAETLNAGGVADKWLSTPGGSRTAFTWTPDGRALVFVGRRGDVQQLYVRRLDAAEANALTGTEGAQVPAVSPDGQWVAFWAARAIRKLPLGGGPVMDLASGLAFPPMGLAWGAGGQLFFGRDDGRIWRIPAEGPPVPVTTLGDAEVLHVLPSVLPGGRELLYTVRRRRESWGDEEVVAQTLATGARKPLLKEAADARYVPTGHLVFLRRGVLFGVPFDAERLEVGHNQVPVLGNVTQALTGGNPGDITGAAQFAIAAVTGVLAYVPSPVLLPFEQVLVTVDRHGQASRLSAPVRSYGPTVRISPDGGRLAVTVRTLTERGLYTVDTVRGSVTPLGTGGEVRSAIWRPDGRRLVFDWLKDGRLSLAEQPVDGTGPPRILTRGSVVPSSVRADGLIAAVPFGGGDVLIVSVEETGGSVKTLFQTPHGTCWWPVFSPDGRWLLYGSNVTGRTEVYVRPYPGPGAEETVSIEGGRDPAWHPDGRELFYVTCPGSAGNCHMMAADFTPRSPRPTIGHPHPLFEFTERDFSFTCAPVRCYDVAPDGQRFYVAERPASPPPPVVTHLNLVLNWFEELKAKVPAGR